MVQLSPLPKNFPAVLHGSAHTRGKQVTLPARMVLSTGTTRVRGHCEPGRNDSDAISSRITIRAPTTGGQKQKKVATHPTPRASVWLSSYIRDLQGMLLQKPSEEVVLDFKTDDTLLNAGKCTICRAVAKEHIKGFQNELTAKLREKFSSVSY